MPCRFPRQDAVGIGGRLDLRDLTWDHRQVMTPALREAARAIVFDPDDRVILLRYEENGGFWATPGGSLEPGETHRQAVVRELREELGVQHVTLGPHLATRTKDHPVAGRNVRQAEHYYLARVQPENVLPQSAASPDNIQERRWWTLAELAATSQTVYPAELTELVREILASGPPPVPLVLR
jgi:ADP-ribose pyrophosphatase YjhB (NUDIX family)